MVDLISTGRTIINGIGEGAKAIGSGTANVVNGYFDNIPNAQDNPWISNLQGSGYNFNIRKFPESIDDPQTSYYGHAMMININVPVYSQYEQTKRSGQNVSIYNDLPHQVNQAGITRNYTSRADQYSRMDTLRRKYDERYTGTNGGKLQNAIDQPGVTNVVRRTRRITESIVLYMPSTANFVQANAYEDFSLVNLLKEVGVGAAQGMATALAGSGAAGAAIAGAAQGAAALAAGAATIASKLNNMPINPRIEVIYGSPMLRTFDFTFDLAPSNARESVAIDNIIRTLRFHAAPETSNYAIGGIQNPFFMTPPAEFDITFFHKGVENTRIPRINTCVLEMIDVDYAVSGTYSTFSNGYPVHTRLALRFKEIEVLNKLRVLQGF